MSSERATLSIAPRRCPAKSVECVAGPIRVKQVRCKGENADLRLPRFEVVGFHLCLGLPRLHTVQNRHGFAVHGKAMPEHKPAHHQFKTPSKLGEIIIMTTEMKKKDRAADQMELVERIGRPFRAARALTVT